MNLRDHALATRWGPEAHSPSGSDQTTLCHIPLHKLPAAELTHKHSK